MRLPLAISSRDGTSGPAGYRPLHMPTYRATYELILAARPLPRGRQPSNCRSDFGANPSPLLSNHSYLKDVIGYRTLSTVVCAYARTVCVAKLNGLLLQHLGGVSAEPRTVPLPAYIISQIQNWRTSLRSTCRRFLRVQIAFACWFAGYQSIQPFVSAKLQTIS